MNDNDSVKIDAEFEMIDTERYARNLMLEGFDASSQLRLQESAVCIVGAGALGSVVAMYLAGAGVGKLRIADFDTVAISNLQRQVFFTEREIGMPKCEMLRDRIVNLNSNAIVECFTSAVNTDNICEFTSGCDVVVECTDKIATKAMLVDAVGKVGLPIVLGGVREFQGQLCVFTGDSTVGYTDMFPVQPDTVLAPPGVFSPVPGIVGSLQAAEVLKLLTGIGHPLKDTLLNFDVRTMTFQKFEL